MALNVWLFIAAVITGLFGLALIASGRARKRGKALRWLAGLVLLAVALPLGGLALLLRHYAWLIEDQPVATISLKQEAPQKFMATLRPTGAPVIERELYGDEWQLDARVIRWQLPAAFA